MKYINYIDIGLWKYPHEIEMINSHICKLFPNIHFNIHGIEAYPPFAKHANDLYEKNDNIKISNLIISDKIGKHNLYINDRNNFGIGNSIFKTKNNVNVNKHVSVESTTLSNFIQKNNIDLENSLCNILKINIEGAELYVWEDMIKNGLNNKFHIICGHPTHDIHKVHELIPQINHYNDLLKKINYANKFLYFCHVDKNRSIKEMKNKLQELI